MKVAGVELHDVVDIGGGDICRAFRATATNGRPVFAKTLADAPARFFEAEADGLRLLCVDGGPPVAAVVAVGPDGLVLDWIDAGCPTQSAAADFGRRLSVLHGVGLPAFGGAQAGFIGTLPLDNTPEADWPSFYANCRLSPYVRGLPDDVRRAVDAVIDRIHELAGPAEPPARLHGDLWSGNVHWAADGHGWLVDAAAAHGGHRETDLAMLSLFGAPHLDIILAAYEAVTPLADGWRRRVALHQLHPLLVHAQLFGGGYLSRALSAARGALAAS